MKPHIKNIYITLCLILIPFSSLTMANDEFFSEIKFYGDVVIKFEGHKWENVTYDISDETKIAFSNTDVQDSNLAFRNINPEYRNLYIIGNYNPPSGKVELQLYDITRGSLRHSKYNISTDSVKQFSEGLNLGEYKWDENKPVLTSTQAVAEIKKTYYDNGVLKTEVNVKNGKPDGSMEIYNKNGSLQAKGHFKNGTFVGGKMYSYYDSGALKFEQNTNKNNKLEGITKHFYENGFLQAEIIFKNHQEVISKGYDYYDNGAMKREWNKKGGKLVGVAKDYYDNGTLKSEANFKNGKPDGVAKDYYDNGVLKSEVNFKNGKQNGISKEYYDNGAIMRVHTFKYDGQLVDLKGYNKDGSLALERKYLPDIDILKKTSALFIQDH